MDIKLVMFKTNGQQKIIPLSKPVTIIGRGQDCDLRIPIESCSRRQCELKLRQGKLTVKDLGSSNGTFVNNNRTGEAVLSAGDKLTIGPIVFTVQIDGKPENISPAAPASAAATEQQGQGGGVIPLEDDSSIDLISSIKPGEAVDAIDAIDAIDALGGGEEADDPISALEALAETKDKKGKKK